MPSSRATFWICLTVSAAAHGVLIWSLPRGQALPARVQRAAAPKYRVAPPGTVPDVPPPQEPAFGEAKGVGDAINSSAGDRPQSAPKSRPDQAALTRGPTGNGPATTPPPKPLAQPVTAPPVTAVPTPPPSPAPAFRKPPPPTPPGPPQPKESPAPPGPETPPQPTPTPPADPSPESATAGTPMPHSDRDSDAFAKEVSVEFKQGRVAARRGREFKFARPRDNLAGFVDGAEIRFPALLRLHIFVDAAGQVRDARITGSTGSSSIDRAYLLAIYASWFEPAKDAAGRPVADDFDFTMRLE